MEKLQIKPAPTVTVEFAAEQVGGKTALARLLGVSRNAIYTWGETLPDLYAYRLKHSMPARFGKIE